MSQKLQECFLKPITNDHPPIPIPVEQTMVGRNADTGIQDVNCSRNQVCLKTNLSEGYVLVKSVGLNPSVLNGQELQKNAGYVAKHGDTIELIPGKYKYTFEFRYTTPSVKQEKSADAGRKSVGQEIDKEVSDTNITMSKRSRHELSDGDEGPSKRPKRERSPTVKQEPPATVKQEHKRSPQPITQGVWESVDGNQLHIYTSAGVRALPKIASYDMDGTLIKTKSGNVFPKSIDDWQITFPEVPGKLKSLNQNGFKLVIFTNQAGIGKGKVRIEDFRKKIESLVHKLGVPMQVFISTGSGRYRKPRPGMWEVLCDKQNSAVPIDKGRSFYVGDAAGRPELKKPVKRKKDHSCADRLLAMNVGIPFLTPEQHFQKLPDAVWTRPEFDPRAVCDGKPNEPLLSPPGAVLTVSGQEVIVMVGFPGSGKSYFVHHHLAPKGYVVINRDTLGSWENCVGGMETSLLQGKSVVIDNMSPDTGSRKRYVMVANRKKVPTRCFVMDVGYKHARHNNEFRQMTDRSHTTISEVVFNSYKSKYEEPTVKEGFTEIVKVRFVPKFASKSHEDLYRMFLLDK